MNFAKTALIALLATFAAASQPLHAQTKTPAPASGGRIHGFAKQGTIPLAGIYVTIVAADSGKKFSTLTDGAGAYSIALPDDGRYSIRAVFRANNASPQEIRIGAGHRDLQLNFSFEGSAVANTLASIWPPLILPPVAVNTIALEPALANPGGASGARFPQFTGDPVFSGDTFTVYGQPAVVTPYFQMADQMRQDFEDGHQLQGPPMRPYFTLENETSADAGSANNGTSADTAAGATGTGDADSSANKSKPHGEIFWTGGNSALNAQPFVIAGQPVPNPAYSSNGYGVTLGAQPFFPGLTKPSPRDYILLSYAGGLASTLVNDYGTVPTALERAGNFSQLVDSNGNRIPIYPPRSATPFPNNTINTPLDPAAVGLLNFLPAPNLDGATGLNYRLLTPQGTHGNTLGLSYSHNFGALSSDQSSRKVSTSILISATSPPTSSIFFRSSAASNAPRITRSAWATPSSTANGSPT